MHVGKRIRERRRDLHMSVDELAKRLGKNRATVYRYEKGDIENLPMDILGPLANALNTTPQYLMGWVDIEVLESEKRSLVTEQSKKWNAEFPPGAFREDEYEKLMDYARFLISQRDKKKEE